MSEPGEAMHIDWAHLTEGAHVTTAIAFVFASKITMVDPDFRMPVPLITAHVPEGCADEMIALRICATDGTTVLVDVMADGEVRLGETYTPDEAAWQFWMGFASFVPHFFEVVEDYNVEET